MGAAAATLLVRIGIGYVRLVDRDVVVTSNLTDQALYTEHDVVTHRLKAEIAAERLSSYNDTVIVEGIVADFGPDNAEALAEGCELIIDGTDNLYTKYLINDLAVKTRRPWIYGGCAGMRGTIVPIIPYHTPCLRCIWQNPPDYVDGCESMGLFVGLAWVIAAHQVTEAVKILSDQKMELNDGPVTIDLWNARIRKLSVVPFSSESKCPTCIRREFIYLRGKAAPQATTLCGRNTVLVRPQRVGFDYERVRNRLTERVPIENGPGYLRFPADDCQVVLYESGRALIQGTADPVRGMALYGRYVGS